MGGRATLGPGGWSVLILHWGIPHTLLVCHCRNTFFSGGVDGQQDYLSILKSFGHGFFFPCGRFDPIPPVVRYGPPTMDHVSFGKATGFPHGFVWKCWLNPIVPNGFADHYPYEKWLAIIGNINPTFSDKPIYTLWWTNILPWKDPPFLMGNPHCSAKKTWRLHPSPQVPPTWPPAVARSHPPQWVGPVRAGCEAAAGAVGDETCGISASLYQ